MHRRAIVLLSILSWVPCIRAVTPVPGGNVYQTTIRNSAARFDHADYSMFLPESAGTVRAILIHQHGCTMEGTGAPTAYDVQYQALAKKWGLVLVGPDLYPKTGSDCADWINPADGSGPALLAALDTVARVSGHAEIRTVPWLLWGHSGGGYWVLAMIVAYPQWIMAAFCYSPAFDPAFTYPAPAAAIPIMIRHAGADDFNAPGIDCWGTALHAFGALRAMNGFAAIAYTPGQNHNFSYVRYMAMPFYEAVLAQRLPASGTSTMGSMDTARAWLGDTATHNVAKLSNYTGDRLRMAWLPDSTTAAKWREYVTTSTVRDVTSPPAPYAAAIAAVGTTAVDLTWKADADIESGIAYFRIYRNGSQVGRFPASGEYQTFNTNGDDASPIQLPTLTYRITGLTAKGVDTLAVSTVNPFGLESAARTVVRNGPATRTVTRTASPACQSRGGELFDAGGRRVSRANEPAGIRVCRRSAGAPAVYARVR